jgi:hypothetical protein
MSEQIKILVQEYINDLNNALGTQYTFTQLRKKRTVRKITFELKRIIRSYQLRKEKQREKNKQIVSKLSSSICQNETLDIKKEFQKRYEKQYLEYEFLTREYAKFFVIRSTFLVIKSILNDREFKF